MERLTNVMLDLETLGTEADSVIVSIGACMFDPLTGRTGEVFDRVIDIDDSLKYGLKITGSTLGFWTKNPGAMKAVFPDEIPKVTLREGIQSFYDFIRYQSGDRLGAVKLWANDPSFDKSMLTLNAREAGVPYPLEFWNTRCVRTILAFYPPELFKQWKLDNPRDGYHIASSDALYQARYVGHILKELGCEELY